MPGSYELVFAAAITSLTITSQSLPEGNADEESTHAQTDTLLERCHDPKAAVTGFAVSAPPTYMHVSERERAHLVPSIYVVP